MAQRIYAHAEASSYLIKALRLLDHLPVTQDHLQQELRLRMAQAITLTALKGFPAFEVKEVYTRAQNWPCKWAMSQCASLRWMGCF